MWKQHLFLIVHVKRIFQSSHLCSHWVFGALVTTGYLHLVFLFDSSTSASDPIFHHCAICGISVNYSREIG